MRSFSQQHAAEVAILRSSIRELKQVAAKYHCFHRIFCPHILGLKDDKWHVLGWQFGGASERGGLPNWRCMALDELSLLSSQDGSWHRGHAKGVSKQYCIDWVDTIVDPAFAAIKVA